MGVPTSPSRHDASGNPPREAPTDCRTIGTATASTTTDTARRPPAFTRAEEEDRTPPRRETPPTRPKNRILGGVLRDDDDDEDDDEDDEDDEDDDFAVRNGGAFRNKEENPINDARRRHVVMIDDEDDCAAHASIGRFLFLPEVEGSHLDGLILADTSPAGRPSPPPPPPPCRPSSSPAHPPESSSRQSSTHDDSTATLSLDEDDVEDKHGSFGRLFLHPATVPRGDPTDRSLRRVVPRKSILKRDDSSCCDSSGSSKTSVSFHSVEVREYDRTVGDHPSCRSGPPLSLDWSYSKNYLHNLNEFELVRSNERVDHPSKLRVNKYRRRNILVHQWGLTEEELVDARRSTKRMQRQRSMTQVLLPMHLAEEVLIGVKNYAKKKKKKRVAVRKASI